MKVLVLEDGSDFGPRLCRLIGSVRPGFGVRSTRIESAQRGAHELAADAILAVVTDGGELSRAQALRIIRDLRSARVQAPIAVITDQASAAAVREWMRVGAQDVLFTSEADPEAVAELLDAFQCRIGLGKSIAAARDCSASRVALIGSSPAMQEIRETVAAVAGAPQPVLVLGETGTGKGLVAKAIHQGGPREKASLVVVNCAATPTNLLESVMFGHERGSFTGAFRRQRGQFEVVGTGTIVLDEIADLPVEVQAKLLRAVEDRMFQPLGAEQEVPFSGRIVSTTNADLAHRMLSGGFRRDLYYRLSVIVIRLPTLAERKGDIPELLEALAASMERTIQFSSEAVAWLTDRRWPGNVRELRNAVERLSVLCPTGRVSLRAAIQHVGECDFASAHEVDHAARIVAGLPGQMASKLAALEGALVRSALREAKGNRSAAARALGVHRRIIDRHAPSDAVRSSPGKRSSRQGP